MIEMEGEGILRDVFICCICMRVLICFVRRRHWEGWDLPFEEVMRGEGKHISPSLFSLLSVCNVCWWGGGEGKC